MSLLWGRSSAAPTVIFYDTVRLGWSNETSSLRLGSKRTLVWHGAGLSRRPTLGGNPFPRLRSACFTGNQTFHGQGRVSLRNFAGKGSYTGRLQVLILVSMSLAAASRKFAESLTPPPSMDWETLLLGDDLKDMERSVDRFETQMTAWRTDTSMKLRKGLDVLRKAASEVDPASTRDIFAETLAGAIAGLEQAIRSLSEPMHEREDIIARLLVISSLAPGVARLVRKQLRRVERTRVLSYNALVDWYYTILAFLSEFEPDEERGPTFSDPAELERFIRSDLA